MKDTAKNLDWVSLKRRDPQTKEGWAVKLSQSLHPLFMCPSHAIHAPFGTVVTLGLGLFRFLLDYLSLSSRWLFPVLILMVLQPLLTALPLYLPVLVFTALPSPSNQVRMGSQCVAWNSSRPGHSTHAKPSY